MTDKILTEAFDKLKAIEESDDPFCIGEAADDFEPDEPADFDADQKSGYPGDNDDEPREHDTDPSSFAMQTDDGDEYEIHFRKDAGQERAVIEENGVTIATYIIGGGGPMQSQIKDKNAVLNALTYALKQTGY